MYAFPGRPSSVHTITLLHLNNVNVVLSVVDIQLCQGSYLNTGFSLNAAELGDWLGACDTHISTGITCLCSVTQLKGPCQTQRSYNGYLDLPSLVHVSLNLCPQLI